MEAEKCYYCKNEADAAPYRNPYTKEIHPTCENCIKEFTSFVKERSFFTKLGCIWLPVFIVLSIIITFFNWRIGLFCLAVGVLFEIVAVKLQSYFVKKKEMACGTYVDPKKVQWCKTCKHFKKVKKFDDIVSGLWREKIMPNQENIPCKILEKTKKLWEIYFNLEQDKRTLYPKDCSFWEKR